MHRTPAAPLASRSGRPDAAPLFVAGTLVAGLVVALAVIWRSLA